MLRLSLAALVIASAACGGGSVDSVDGGADTPSISAVTPNYGRLSGGSHVLISGNGFLYGGAPPNRVLIDGVEVTAAGVVDDNTLDVVVPPGDVPGDVDIVVFNQNGQASASGLFHYSEAPTISDVTPATAEYTGGGVITVHGTGFLDEDAGSMVITLDGERVFDVEIPNDTTALFPAPIGRPISKPDLTLSNERGEAALADAFQYVVAGTASGLLVFPSVSTEVFAWFVDPVALTITPIPQLDHDGVFAAFRAVARDATGQVYAINKTDNTFNKLDLDRQTLSFIGASPNRFPSMVFVGDILYAYRRSSTFGTLDKSTGAYSVIASTLAISTGGGLTANSVGTIFAFTNNNLNISQVNPTTGALVSPVVLTPVIAPYHFQALTFHAGVLYALASTRQTTLSKIVSINPTTGAITDVLALPAKGADLLDAP